MDEERLNQSGPDGGAESGPDNPADNGTDNPAGNEPGSAPNHAPGNAPGNKPGSAPNHAPDNEPGNEPGNAPDNAPIRDWSTVNLDLPEDAAVDPDVLDGFGKTAVELGLTPRQARALAHWQLESVAARREALMEAGVRELGKAWGGKAAHNQQAVLSLISRIDRLTGDESFSTALGRSGATCFPGVVKGLLAVAGLLSEDSMGGGGAAAQAEHEETALEGLENALKDARRSGK